mgnify:CR=1 FL=1
MKIDIQKTDTSKFLYDPNSEEFVFDVQKDIPELLQWNLKMDKILFLRFLAIMYDIASPLNRVYQSSPFMTRKLYACQSAGFKFTKDGRLSDEDMAGYIKGKHDYLNDITVKYLRLFGRPEWMYIVANMAILDDYTKQSIEGSVDHRIPKNLDMVTENLKIAKNKMLFTGGEEESEKLTRAFYREVEKDRGLPIPEKIHEQLHTDDGNLQEYLTNPYGDHVNSEMEYIGDE